jgi:hypothetical protein
MTPGRAACRSDAAATVSVRADVDCAAGRGELAETIAAIIARHTLMRRCDMCLGYTDGRLKRFKVFTMHDSSRFRHSCVRLLTMLLAVLAAAAPTRAQTPAAPSARVTIGGDVGKAFSLTAADLKTMSRTTVKVVDDGARTTVYEGVLLGDVLARAGAPLGRDLSGPALATYVLVTATDGYQVVFAIAEVDPAMSGSEIIVADSINGTPLTGDQGSMRIVAPHDKRAARWVRMLQRIEVVGLRK